MTEPLLSTHGLGRSFGKLEVLSGLEEGQEIIITKPRESVISTGMFGG